MNYIDYIIEFLIGEKNKELKKILSYGENKDAKLIIVPSGFFDESIYMTKRSLPKEPISKLNGIPILFGSNHIEKRSGKLYLYADVIASTFFLITRYEECIKRDKRDEHGRFLSKYSITSKYNLIDICVVDEYGRILRDLLRKLDICVEEPDKEIKNIFLTHDIDHIWTWDGYLQATKTSCKRILTGKGNLIEPFKAVINYKKYDPCYTFPWMIKTDVDFKNKSSIPSTIIYFLMGTKNKSIFDAGYSKYMSRTSDLVELLIPTSEIGYHVSYSAKDNNDLINQEIDTIKKYTNKSVRYSRNHYLASKEPEDYRVLIDFGITDDFTMGYPDRIGFRLGTCRPVKWIDPESKKVTELILHPMTVMECTLDHYMGIINEEEAFSKVKNIIEEIRKNSGEITLLWHNQ